MNDISVVIDLNRFPELARTTPQEIGRRVTALAHLGRNYVVTQLHRGGASRSAPGQPPKTDTGALANSITVQNTGSFQREIAAGVEYAAFLEFGTRKMAARPFMTPMALWLETQVIPVFRDLVR